MLLYFYYSLITITSITISIVILLISFFIAQNICLCYTYIGDRMYEYIRGKIINQESNYRVLDNNGYDYKLYNSTYYIDELDYLGYHEFLYEERYLPEKTLDDSRAYCEKEMQTIYPEVRRINK